MAKNEAQKRAEAAAKARRTATRGSKTHVAKKDGTAQKRLNGRGAENGNSS